MEEFFGGRDDGRGEVGFYECGVVRLGGVREELDAPGFGLGAGGGGCCGGGGGGGHVEVGV